MPSIIPPKLKAGCTKEDALALRAGGDVEGPVMMPVALLTPEAVALPVDDTLAGVMTCFIFGAIFKDAADVADDFDPTVVNGRLIVLVTPVVAFAEIG